MRVALISLHWVEYLIELANSLAGRGHTVDVIFNRRRVEATVGDRLRDLVAPEVTCHVVDDRERGLRDPRQLATVGRLITTLRGLRPDVIHAHESTVSYLPLCFALGPRVPLVLTIHDVMPHPGADSAQPARKMTVRRKLRRRASAVILHGDALRDEYLTLDPGFCRNAHVIPHGCYTTYPRFLSAPVEETPRSVLFFGRIHEYKGLPVLLEAAERVAAEVAGFRLVVAGGGSELERHRADLLRRSYCSLQEGYLSNEAVAETFARSSVVVLPYIEGSASGVVRIAYAFGKPVVVTDVGSVAECVRDGVTGMVVPPRDSAALARALVRVLFDDALRRRMSDAALRMTTEDMSWDRIAARTEDVYREVLGARTGAKRSAAVSSTDVAAAAAVV
jgi:glycosyltransferase involved in cell wall biosynthesis